MNITVKTDLYIVKEVIKKTTLTKRLNVGDKINLIGYLDSSNSRYAKLKSTQFQLVINGKKTDIFMPQRKMETFLKEQLLVVNISKDDVINSFEEQDLKSVKLEDTKLGNDFAFAIDYENSNNNKTLILPIEGENGINESQYITFDEEENEKVLKIYFNKKKPLRQKSKWFFCFLKRRTF